MRSHSIVVVFAIHSDESATGVHVFLILTLPPTSLPSHPSGSSRCTGPVHPVSCIEPRLAIYFTYDNIYVSMVFASHPRLLPQNPKICFLHLCLFCYLTYRVIVTIFLSSIYMRYYTILVFFFLTYFTLYNRLQFHIPH